MTKPTPTPETPPASPPLPAPAGSAAEPRGGDHPPPAKKGWDHSERVLVYYPADPEMDRTDKWSIAYFHHNPPFEQKPHWVDFNTDRGAPDYWWPLPELPNDPDHSGSAASKLSDDQIATRLCAMLTQEMMYKADCFDYLCWLEETHQEDGVKEAPFLVLASDGTTCWGKNYADCVKVAMKHDKELYDAVKALEVSETEPTVGVSDPAQKTHEKH